MKKFWVYIHTCPNGKKYVGITTASKPERRWLKGNGYRYNDHFYRAILKYGWDNITHEVFEVDSKEEMYRKEVELISFYHSNDPNFGYNHSIGGENGSLGCKHSEEYRENLSKVRKGKLLSEEAKKKISEAAKKRNSDPEYRKRVSEAIKESLSDPEVRRKKSEAHKGKTLSEETKKKLSEANKKRCSDPEYRKKLSEAAKKRKPISEEARKHRSEARKGKPGKPHSEETKKKMSESHKGKPRKPWSEEYRKKKSEAMKGKPKPRIKISLPDGTIIETTKQALARNYINKGRKFEYLSE